LLFQIHNLYCYIAAEVDPVRDIYRDFFNSGSGIGGGGWVGAQGGQHGQTVGGAAAAAAQSTMDVHRALHVQAATMQSAMVPLRGGGAGTAGFSGSGGGVSGGDYSDRPRPKLPSDGGGRGGSGGSGGGSGGALHVGIKLTHDP
jgi:hypothetical protein